MRPVPVTLPWFFVTRRSTLWQLIKQLSPNAWAQLIYSERYLLSDRIAYHLYYNVRSLPCSGIRRILSAESPSAFTVSPSSHVTYCEVMSDVIFLWRVATPGVHWRFKETLQWSEPHLFTMPRSKRDSWRFRYGWGEFRLSLTLVIA